jgi:hypothetical protein
MSDFSGIFHRRITMGDSAKLDVSAVDGAPYGSADQDGAGPMEPELSAEVSSSTNTNGGQSAMACYSLSRSCRCRIAPALGPATLMRTPR